MEEEDCGSVGATIRLTGGWGAAERGAGRVMSAVWLTLETGMEHAEEANERMKASPV